MNKTMSRLVEDQFQVALIWMRDVNLARAESSPQGMLTRLAARDLAEYQLDRYFDMLEAQMGAECS